MSLEVTEVVCERDLIEKLCRLKLTWIKSCARVACSRTFGDATNCVRVFTDAMRRHHRPYQAQRQSFGHRFRHALSLRQSFHFALLAATVAVTLRRRTLRYVGACRHHRRNHHLTVLDAARKSRAIIVARPLLANLIELVVDDAFGFHALAAALARYRLQLVTLFDEQQ